ncbi:AAA family ATPase [Rhizobium sp. CSW-27]|uniref:AAA family ATPase n=1 Tax=Rhizobium sp. CSW-27 TaxID=2839985 RepID=UPI001C00A19A|nr:AAA family ATPase [Rhizobium sp. CSW-27]MBT9373452.1 ATP-binding protein [Rhizobium sp. CSW-27]
MHVISKVSVEGFWETYNFDFAMNNDVTFFIGQNGTGKTTLINLIAAALEVDLRTLVKIPFKKITISFDRADKNKQAFISVTKKEKKERPFEQFEYVMLNPAVASKEVKLTLGDEPDWVHYEPRWLNEHARFNDFSNRGRQRIARFIERMVNVNWLSVNRISLTAASRDDKTYELLVDKKLEGLSNDLVRYFASLSKRKDEEVRLFQESLFMTLLEQHEDFNPFEFRHVYRTDLEQYGEVLKNIFAELHVENERVQPVIGAFINRAKSIIQRLAERDRDDKGILLNEAIFVSEFRKIENIVDRWNNIQDKLNEIFSPKDRFLSICNALFQRKSMTLDAENEFQFTSRSGKPLTTAMLSSGEKQLLILLSEVLLQREQPFVFIADEPELSLHVLWQEKLIGSLRHLNPNAQIIVATHSPDIVGALADNAIDMESLIR